MPSITDELFEHIAKRQIAKALDLLKNNPELVNAIEPSGLSLFKYTEGRMRTAELIEYTVTHEKFDLHFTDRKGSNLEHMIRLGCHDLISRFVGNRNIIYNTNGELTYITAVTALEDAKTKLQEYKSKDSYLADTQQKFVDKITLVLSHVRDITILYAIEHDDATLMQQLDAVGGNSSHMLGPLGNNRLPSMLLTPKNVKIEALREQKLEKASIEMMRTAHVFFKDMKELERTVKKVTDIEQSYQDRAAASDQKAADGYQEVLDKTAHIVKGR